MQLRPRQSAVCGETVCKLPNKRRTWTLFAAMSKAAACLTMSPAGISRPANTFRDTRIVVGFRFHQLHHPRRASRHSVERTLRPLAHEDPLRPSHVSRGRAKRAARPMFTSSSSASAPSIPLANRFTIMKRRAEKLPSHREEYQPLSCRGWRYCCPLALSPDLQMCLEIVFGNHAERRRASHSYRRGKRPFA